MQALSCLLLLGGRGFGCKVLCLDVVLLVLVFLTSPSRFPITLTESFQTRGRVAFPSPFLVR